MDFEAEGLLDGLHGSQREARLELLRKLAESGVTLDELKQACEEGRLALLPAERVLESESRYSARDLERLAGVSPELFATMRRAAGLPVDAPDELAYDDGDLEAARAISSFVEFGLPVEGLIELARIFGELTARTAAATRNFIAEVALASGDPNEAAVGIQLAEAARDLRPLTEFLVQRLYRLHLREQIRNEVAVNAQLQGSVPGLHEVTVAFVDLVGFTSLGEEIAADELGGLAGRLAGLIADSIEAPVQLTKMIGDAGMLVSEDTDALLEAALRLVDAAQQPDVALPGVKVGVARGEAIHKWGDWYGNPVNVASRVTGVARTGSVLVTKDVRDAAKGEYRWSFAGHRRLRGVSRELSLHRVRLPD